MIDAIERQMAHYASHVGQIVYIGKQIKGGRVEYIEYSKRAIAGVHRSYDKKGVAQLAKFKIV